MYKDGDFREIYIENDLRQTLDKLKHDLKQINYPHPFLLIPASQGVNKVYVPILQFCFLIYSNFITEQLAEYKYVLTSKSEMEFIDIVFEALINLFNYNPFMIVKKTQFLSDGAAKEKAKFCIEVIRLVKLEHYYLAKKYVQVNRSVFFNDSNTQMQNSKELNNNNNLNRTKNDFNNSKASFKKIIDDMEKNENDTENNSLSENKTENNVINTYNTNANNDSKGNIKNSEGNN